MKLSLGSLNHGFSHTLDLAELIGQLLGPRFRVYNIWTTGFGIEFDIRDRKDDTAYTITVAHKWKPDWKDRWKAERQAEDFAEASIS